MRKDKNKQLISLALAGSMVAGMSPALVAHATIGEDNNFDNSYTTTSANEEKVSEATKKLNALGIVSGREDGKFYEDANITRAEFTKLVLYTLGMDESSFAIMKDVKVFEDVSPTAWYAGIVNMAYSMNLVSGIGENKFAPEREITHAEALTILVNALGYKDTIGANTQWPIGHLAKASELGLLKGANLTDSKAPAKRGEVFQYMVNALDVKVLEKTGNTFKQSDKTLLEKKLDMVSTTVEVVEVGGLLNSGLEENEIRVRGIFDSNRKKEETKVFTLKAEVANPMDLLFKEVKIIVNKNNEINFLQATNSSTMSKTDIVEKVVGLNVYMKELDNYYPVSEDAEIIIDYTVSTKSDLAKIKENAKISYEVKGKKIVKLVATNYNKPLIVETVKNNNIIIRNASNINLAKLDVKVFLNGAKASVEDLKEYDIAYTFKDKNTIVIEAYRNVATGEVTRVDSSATPKYVYLNSKKFDIDSKNVLCSVDNGKTLTNLFDHNLLGQDVSIYHDAHGKVMLIIGETKATQGNFFVVERVIRDVLDSTNKEISNWVKLVDKTGKTQNYKLSNKIKISDIGLKSFVAVVFDGEMITSIEEVTSSKAKLGRFEQTVLRNVNFEDKVIDIDGLRIRHNGKYFFIDSDNIPVFFIDKSNEISVGKIKDLAGATGRGDMTLIIDGNDVHYIFVEDNGGNLDISSEKETAVLLDSYRATKDGERGLYFELSNGKSYFVKDSVEITKAFSERGYGNVSQSLVDIENGDIITYSLDERDRIEKVEELDLTNNFDLHLNIVKDVRRNSIKIGDTWYPVAEKVSIVDLRDGNIEYYDDIRDIDEDTRVAFSLNKFNEINAISIIADKDDVTYVETLVNENKALDAVHSLEKALKSLEDLETKTMDKVTALKTQIGTTKGLVAKVETNRVKADLTAKVVNVETKVTAIEEALLQKELVTTATSKVTALEEALAELIGSGEITVEDLEALEELVVEAETLIAEIKDETVKAELTERVEDVKTAIAEQKALITPEEEEETPEEEEEETPEEEEEETPEEEEEETPIEP